MPFVSSLSLFLALLIGPILYALRHCVVTCLTSGTRALRHQCSPPPACSQKGLLMGLDILLDAISAVRSRRLLDWIKISYQRHGNTFTKQILLSSNICMIEPENLRSILSTNFRRYGISSVRKDALLPLLGHSILLAEGTAWAHTRAIFRPAFSKKQIADLEMFDVHVKRLITAIKEAGSTLDLGDLFRKFATDVTTESMYGVSICSLGSGSFKGVMEAFQDAQDGCERRARLGKLANLVPHPAWNRNLRVVREYIESHIERARQHQKRQESLGKEKTEERYVLLHELGKVIDDKKQLRNELVTVFFAGRDTIASLLCSLFFTIAKRSDIWLRLRSAVAHLNGERPTFEQLKRLQYVTYCLNESMCPYSYREEHKNTSFQLGSTSD